MVSWEVTKMTCFKSKSLSSTANKNKWLVNISANLTGDFKLILYFSHATKCDEFAAEKSQKNIHSYSVLYRQTKEYFS